MYVCPICKQELDGSKCGRCLMEFELSDGVPIFFTKSSISKHYREIGSFYDNLYQTEKDVWKEVAGRGREFVKYMASLVESYAPERYLDAGCGQGFLLKAVSVREKFGIEISQEAIRIANSQVNAKLCQGCIEELPYLSNYFDVVTGIGVIRHLLDYLSATKEINRVLRTDGIYIIGSYLKTPVVERIMIKISDFLYPSFRPLSLIRWVQRQCSKLMKKQVVRNHSQDEVGQPVQVEFTERSIKKLFKSTGFEIVRLITKRKSPDAPLDDHYFRIYVLKKRKA
jgi:ubiquinone/menaquinone biosynthesis C-methylase UbiE